jgi:hypothetical protein
MTNVKYLVIVAHKYMYIKLRKKWMFLEKKIEVWKKKNSPRKKSWNKFMTGNLPKFHNSKFHTKNRLNYTTLGKN